MKYAVIKDNKVMNVILWDGISPIFQNNPEITLVQNDDNTYQIGMYFENGEWHKPIPPEPTELELLLEEEQQLLNDLKNG